MDAHGFWHSGGNRPIRAEEVEGLSARDLFRLFRRRGLETVYGFESHVELGEWLEERGSLPKTFMLLQPPSWHPEVWTDVARMRTMNTLQARKGRVAHLCLAQGSLVLTRDGFQRIEHVKIGDLVLTHRGRWRPVLEARRTGRREAVRLRAQGVPGITMTEDHRVWARLVRGIPWAKAHSRQDAMGRCPQWAPCRDTVGSYVNLKLPPAETPRITEENYWWIVGRYLADGHIDKRGGLIISYPKSKERELLSRLGDRAGNKPRNTGSCFQLLVRDRSRDIRTLLERCGNGAHNKRLPGIAFSLPQVQAAALLEGYLAGDGHYLEERRRWTATSTSRELLLGLAMLAQRAFGALASVYPGRQGGESKIDGRTVNTRREWVLAFDMPSDGRRNGPPFLLEDGAWKRVRSVEAAGDVELWNLRVAEDESFTAEGLIVKNCPLQFDVARRVIGRLSNPGDVVLDPFGGLMTVPMTAVEMGRFGLGIELSQDYWEDGAAYCAAAERKASMPTLFDLEGIGEQP